MIKTIGYACTSAEANLAPHTFERRAPRDNDVVIEILYCGVCHSDIHMAQNDWGVSFYPLVPGHEIVGKVIGTGAAVGKFRIGDYAAVGCLVDSCQNCDQCCRGQEQFCREGCIGTYSARDRNDGSITLGGYSKHIVVREEFVCTLPNELDIARAAPLLCAGITTYSPLRAWKVAKGSRVGIVGMGGLGHMAAKLALAMGAQVTIISRSPEKQRTARAMGVDNFVLSSDFSRMSDAANAFDLIIDTIPVKHDLDLYIPLLDIDATLVVVGHVGSWGEVNGLPLIEGRRRISGSPIGGLHETQELIDFCAKNNILPDCQFIRIDQINSAFERLQKGDLPYRFVINMSDFGELV